MGSTAAGLTHQILREFDLYLGEEEVAKELQDHANALSSAQWEAVPLKRSGDDGDLTSGTEEREEEERKHVTLRDRIAKFIRILLPHIGLTVVLLAYVCGGAAVFQYLEAGTELTNREAHVKRINRLYKEIANRTIAACSETPSINKFEDEVIRQLNLLSSAHESNWREPLSTTDNAMESLWTFPAAVLYALTVLTTTGYDHVSPQTGAGKLFAVFFGLIGIPLMFITAADIGKFLSEVFVKLWYRFIECRRAMWEKICRNSKRLDMNMDKDITSESDFIGGAEDMSHVELPIVAYFGLILSYCGLGGWLYTSWESSSTFDFLHAFHFSFNTITTIGLGNIVVHSALYLSCIIAYVIIGLAVVTMCVDLASSQLKLLFSRIHYFGRTMRTARDAFANMSDDLREAIRVVAAIRRNQTGRGSRGNQITVEDIRRYLELEARSLRRPFIPANIHVIQFVDEEQELSSASFLSVATLGSQLARTNSDPNLHSC